MAISVEEIGKEKKQAEISPMRRAYFTIPEFRKIRSLLIQRDLLLKRGIYAALEVPAYWNIDRRDLSVMAYTEPRRGEYMASEWFKGEHVSPAPGLEFLRITSAQIVEEI